MKKAKADQKEKKLKTLLLENKLLKIFLIIFLVGLIVFFSISFINFNFSLLFGWILGTTAIFISFLFNLLSIKIIFKKDNKIHVALIIFLKIFFIFFIQTLLIVMIIYLNKLLRGSNSFYVTKDFLKLNFPISIYSYFGAILNITISALIWFIIKNIKQNKKIKNGKI